MDRSKYTDIVDQYANDVFRISLSYTKNRSDAEDVVQEVFLKLLQQNTVFEDDEHIKKWLFRVAINRSKDMCTTYWRKKVVSIDELDSKPDQDFKRSEESNLYEAVMALPKKYRLVVHLYYYEDYSVREIAEIVGIKETTVQTQLMRARKKLKLKLKEEWKDE